MYTFKTLTPLLVRSQAGRASIVSPTMRIPASTVGGAVAVALEDGGLLSRRELPDLVAEGHYVFSDAYYVRVSDGKAYPTLPAPFPCYRVKVQHLLSKVFEDAGGNILCVEPSRLGDPDTILGGLESVVEWLNTIFENRAGVPLTLVSKDATGTPMTVNACREYEGRLLCFGEKAVVKTVWRDSVAISPHTRRSVETMLYGYEAIADKKLFWGLAILSDSLGVDGKCYEVYMGGGRSRGFGRAKICFKRITLPSSSSGGWHLLISPLPVREKVHIDYMPKEKATMIVTGWSAKPRADVLALKPGVIIWFGEGAAYNVVDPPWGFTLTTDFPHVYEPIARSVAECAREA